MYSPRQLCAAGGGTLAPLQRCPNCGARELKIIAAILERPAIEKVLAHLGLDPQPPPKGRTHEPALHFAA